ncbi:MAG: XrtA/PEP-CTERM system histidine kinase PrsK [Porticoccaceae bacterium]
MAFDIGFFTYLAASASFAILGILLLTYRRVKSLGPTLFLACVVTSVWAGTIAFSTIAENPVAGVVQLTELIRDGCWLFVLLQLLGLQSEGDPWSIQGRRWRRLFFPLFAVALVPIILHSLVALSGVTIGWLYQPVVVLLLIFPLLGLLLIEQLFRNASDTERWSIKYLCFGLGAMLAYDFFMYAETLLFRAMDTELWQARGLINALATPLLAVAIARNSNWGINLHVSRQIVFHTVTLMGAGLYLLGMAVAGYSIKYLGGSWGTVLQWGFLVAAALLLLSVLFSGKLRARIQVLLSKHFFSYRYDYREEWLKFTLALASLNSSVAEGIIRMMAALVSSPAGLLWASDERQPMRLLAHWEMPPPQDAGESLGQLPDWLQEKDWVIDLNEWRQAPDRYDNLVLPAWLRDDRSLWLIVPLVFRDRLEAILMLRKSALKQGINWEDRDLLKTAGRQAATHLAQHLASKALVEARQFDAFNRLSAYVIHDLKNILAQQSLILSNAVKHRNNPAFIDDMIATVENSVARMQRLMEQMRSGTRSSTDTSVRVAPLLREVIKGRAGVRPVPRGPFAAPDGISHEGGAELALDECVVAADPERLATVFSHLIQNAQEATDPQGVVTARLRRERDRVVIDIEDSGRGMDAEFIRDRLFHPFESTKGLTGMGIGAFESRDYIRQLGGDISVDSTPGKGSAFHIAIPLAAPKGGGEKAAAAHCNASNDRSVLWQKKEAAVANCRE